jgi:hypothetical protein
MSSFLSPFIGQTLTWVPTATFKARFDLTAPDGSVLASLDLSNWSSKAQAQVPEGNLFLRARGFSGMKIEISWGEDGPLVATYQRSWWGRGGNLSFADGRVFQWRAINFWGTRKAWTSPSTTSYFEFAAGSFTRKVTVDVLPSAAQLPETSLFLVLGLYNILIERRAAAAAASASV